MTRFHLSAVTHTGSVRRANEDAYGATGLAASSIDGEVVSTTVSVGPCLAVVADGLGGHPRGEVASGLAIEHLLGAGVADPAALVAAIHEANEAIVAAMSEEGGSVGMGTTVAAVLLHAAGLAVVNVGDSAVFELIEDRLVQLSTDDVPASRNELPGLPSSIVTQTLGGGKELVEIEPHLHEDERRPTRRILLCTDGLTNFVPRSHIAEALRRHDGDTAAEVLLSLALAAGGPDNITVLVIDAESTERTEDEQ